VRANLVYREFTRVGGGKVPDDKTRGRLARQLGPEVVEKVHQRVVEIALEKKVAAGRKLRVDTTGSKPTFTIRRTAACWATVCEC
jgi:IS5 family transposase